MSSNAIETKQKKVPTRDMPESSWIRAVNGTVDGFWEWDLRTDRVWYSDSFRDQLGYSKEEFPEVLESWSERLHPEDYSLTFEAMEKHFHAGEPFDIDCRIMAKSGKYQWFRVRGTAYRYGNGDLRFMAGSSQNIDDLKTAQQVLVEKEAQLRQQQKMDAIGSFATGIAHEFNNLHQVISGYTTFAMQDLEEGTQVHEDLQHVYQASQRAATLTSKLLDFGRPESAHAEDVELGEIIDALEMLAKPFFPKNIEFSSNVQHREAVVHGDPHQLQQALLNICLNARDAMPEGGELSVRSELVTFSSVCAGARSNLQPGNYVCLLVTDNGSGIAKSIQQMIFEPFFTTNEIGKGVGLGLSISHNVVQQAGGHIEVYSHLQEGTTFRVYLPNLANQQDPLSQGSFCTDRGERILLVDGEALTCEAGRHILAQAGYEVFVSLTGKEGLRCFHKNQKAIDLIVLSKRLTDMSGREFYDQIRELDSDVPFCITAGYDPESVLCAPFRSLGCPVISRPFDEVKLLKTVGDLLEPMRTRQVGSSLGTKGSQVENG